MATLHTGTRKRAYLRESVDGRIHYKGNYTGTDRVNATDAWAKFRETGKSVDGIT